MTYKVIKGFLDLQTGAEYFEGDTYPLEGTKASKDRIAELLGSDNKQGRPLIKKIPAKRKKTACQPC